MPEFNQISEASLAYFKSILGEERVLVGEQISPDFGRDELTFKPVMPEAVLQVETEEEIRKIVLEANAQLYPLTVRGQGTGLVGGAVPIRGGILLDMSKMDSILFLDEDNLTLSVEPGVLLQDVTAYVEARGYFYPPDPGEKTASIGGNIATNAGGMRAVKYGVTRDYIRGLRAITPTGQPLQVGGNIVKNSSGYALKDLLIGSEGTLAIITQATLRLLPLPKESISMLAPFSSLNQAMDCVATILKSGSQPVALEFLERQTILDTENFLGKKFPHSTSPAYLLLSFDGNSKEHVDQEFAQAAEICLSQGALDAFIIDTEERKSTVWDARGAFLEAIKASTDELDECDVVVPRPQIAEFMAFAHSLEEKYQMPIRGFGHAGDGNLHVYVLRDGIDEKTWQSKRKNIMEELYQKAFEFKGQVSGEHGIGFEKKEYLPLLAGPEAVELMRGIKAVFDPNGILNPGKIF
ncbi:MAG: FAD-binding oxidoreductase [Firmicutes bacterium]|jgi:glycolate oxidase|nr:FAD-binding oxidoreductase [Bacillota bacterium]